MLRPIVFTVVPGLTAVAVHGARFPLSGSLDVVLAGATYVLSAVALGVVAFFHRRVLVGVRRIVFGALLIGVSAAGALLLASSPNWPFTDIGFVLAWPMGVGLLGFACLRVAAAHLTRRSTPTPRERGAV